MGPNPYNNPYAVAIFISTLQMSNTEGWSNFLKVTPFLGGRADIQAQTI